MQVSWGTKWIPFPTAGRLCQRKRGLWKAGTAKGGVNRLLSRAAHRRAWKRLHKKMSPSNARFERRHGLRSAGLGIEE